MDENARMRLCFITPSISKEKGGLARYAREVIPRIRDKVDLKVVTRRMRGRWLGTTFWILSNTLSGRLEDCQVVHANAFRAGIIPHTARKRYVLHCHDVGPQRLYKFRAFLQRVVTKNAVKIISPTEAIKKAIKKHKMASEENIRVIYNGVDTKKFRPIKMNKPETPQVFYPGRTAPYKGLRVLERAISILRGEGVECKLVLLEKWKTDTELVQAYNASSVVVISSLLGEGFSFAATEALACGSKVVASNLPAIRETAGEFALYAKPGDSADLANKIKIALEMKRDPWKTHSYIETRFSWTRHVQDLLKVYRETLE